ncbi:MAG: citrate lyase acyl carrier protein [Clostridiales bacterium]|nr:citrate lyase acyl carrier protein [Clostridiales bacterium]
MEIKKYGTAGTLESSDAMVTVEPVEKGSGIDFELESAVIHQYGNSIRKTVLTTLENLGVEDVRIRVVDKGALDCTLKARVEAAVYRSLNQIDHIPWGGAVR